MKKFGTALIVTGTLMVAMGSCVGAMSGTESQEVQQVAETMTIGQKNAVKQAETYLRNIPFSESGLISQLEYEGYSLEDATFAVGEIEVDWNEQAELKAESYLANMAFSKDGLYNQLIHEGFTEEQANFGVDAVGY